MPDQPSQPPPPPPAPNRHLSQQAGGSVPVVEVLGWTPRARGPSQAARRPPARQQPMHPPYPSDIPSSREAPKPHQQLLPPPPLPMHMQHNYHGHHHMPRHPPPMMPPPLLPPPPPQMLQTQGHAENGRGAAAATTPPAWLTGGYSTRAPSNGGSVGAAEFVGRGPSANGSVGRISNLNGVGPGSELRHVGSVDAKGGFAGSGNISDFPMRSAVGTDGSGSSSAESHEAWCKKRIEAIEAAAKGEAIVPELKQLMETMRVPIFNKHRENLRMIRKDKWAARERVQSATQDLRKLEREFMRIDAHATHIDLKIARLRSYSVFIENGWQENSESSDEVQKANDDGADGSRRASARSDDSVKDASAKSKDEAPENVAGP